jgi:hypothetical protein
VVIWQVHRWLYSLLRGTQRPLAVKDRTAVVSLNGRMEVRLKKGELWKSRTNENGLSILCEGGMVWITQEGDPRDIILKTGEGFQIDRRGLVIAQALETAKIAVIQDDLRSTPHEW